MDVGAWGLAAIEQEIHFLPIRSVRNRRGLGTPSTIDDVDPATEFFSPHPALETVVGVRFELGLKNHRLSDMPALAFKFERVLAGVFDVRRNLPRVVRISRCCSVILFLPSRRRSSSALLKSGVCEHVCPLFERVVFLRENSRGLGEPFVFYQFRITAHASHQGGDFRRCREFGELDHGRKPGHRIGIAERA